MHFMEFSTSISLIETVLLAIYTNLIIIHIL